MAKQKNAPPRLSTLVDDIKSASKMAGKPVTQRDMAKALFLSEQHFSSLINRDRDGEEMPMNIGETLRLLELKFGHLLLADILIKPDLNETVQWLIREAIRDRAERAFLMAREKDRMTPKEWKTAQAIIARDEERQLAELEEKGFVS